MGAAYLPTVGTPGRKLPSPPLKYITINFVPGHGHPAIPWREKAQASIPCLPMLPTTKNYIGSRCIINFLTSIIDATARQKGSAGNSQPPPHRRFIHIFISYLFFFPNFQLSNVHWKRIFNVGSAFSVTLSPILQPST